MNYEYPEEHELKMIEKWEYTDFPGLMKYIEELWSYPQYWKETHIDPNYTKYEISTGGWSGNEDIVGAMMSNSMFWMNCWLISTRGGHYEFEVKDND